MSSQSNPILTLSREAGGDILPCRLITYSGVQSATRGQAVLGVNRYRVSEGQIAAVDVLGTTLVETGGAFVAGDALTSDAQGRAIKITAAASQKRFATALEASSASGKKTEVLLG